ncbi:hypothetical protein [Halomicrobium salinisoli]|uniref:hypothetical protein n=1 Tax=Halomicrobium salinisoli TaxID=2878391 RepID=UPI001CF03F30|nr:hypothetical protein [Halomicrobium salinisoli]
MPTSSARPSLRGSPSVREYGAVFLLLLASGVAQRLVTGAVAWVSDRTPVLLDPNLVGTVVYTGLALTALAAVYVAVRRLRPSVDPLERDELLAVGGTAAFFLGIAAYRVHGAADLPVFPGSVVSSLLQGGVAMGALALGYARLRGIEVPLSLPDRDARPVLGAAVLAAVLAGLAWVVTLVLTSPWIRDVASVDPVFSGFFAARQPSVGSLLLDSALPGVFVGFGTALLYNGAVQGGLRGRAGRLDSLAAVTALVGTFQWTLVPIGRLTGVTAPVALTAGAAAVSVVVAALTARAVRALRRSYGVAVTPALAATAGVLAVVGPPAVLAVALSYPASGLAYVGAFTAVTAVAAVGYERSRSAWVPAAAFATFLAVANRDVALLLAQFVG